MTDLTSKLKDAVSFLNGSQKKLDLINEKIAKKNGELITLPSFGQLELKDIVNNDNIRTELEELERQKKSFTENLSINRDVLFEILLPFKGREILFDYTSADEHIDTIMLEVYPVVSQNISNGFMRTSPRKPQFSIYFNKNKIA